MKQENNCALPQEGAFRTTIGGQALIEGILMPVSYTHLTLPTICSV